MKLTGRIHHFLGLAVALGAAGAVHATSLVSDLQSFSADVRNYNLITLGDATLNGSSDTQGGIAIGGNLSIGGAWTIASNSSDDPNPSLYVNGSLTLSGTTYLNNGFASIASATTANGWTWNSPNSKDLSGHGGSLDMNSNDAKASIDPDANAGPSGWNWTTVGNNLKSISSDLAGASVGSNTITVDSGGNLDLNTTQTSGIVVFDLDASKLGTTYSNLKNISINVPTGVNYVINVLNLSDNQTLFNNVNFNSGTNDDQLLWNFSQTTAVTVNMGGNFYGSILAPNVMIDDDTTINGTVVASCFTDNGVELHDSDEFVDVNVPEPRTYALWAVGLCGLVVVFGRRLRRPAPLAL